MKKALVIALLLLMLPHISMGQSMLPASVAKFLQEHERTERLKFLPKELQIPTRYVPARMIDGREMVDAFIAISNESIIPLLQNKDVTVNCIFDGFVTAQIPIDRLIEVSLMPGVTDVEVSQKVELCTDSTLSVTHTAQVLNGIEYGLPMDYDGQGVIVGIIDVGFDFQHRAFKQENNLSKSRIVRVYNTHDNSGHIARYNRVIKLPGSVFMGNEINALTTDNTSTHGTHTASIAAGTHVNGYGGMAPKADIVLCAVTVLDGSMSLVEVANCVRYIDSYADSVGKPCVMSVSVSTGNGQHDGKDYLSKVISQIMGPGRIFVISSGNNGNKPFYAHRLATPSNPLNLLLFYNKKATEDSTYYYGGHYSEIWMRKNRTSYNYKLHILDKQTRTIVWESEQFSGSTVIGADVLNHYYTYDSTVDTTGFIKTISKTSSDGQKYGLEIEVYNLITKSYKVSNGVKRSRYAIGVSICPRYLSSCDIDAWVYVTSSGFGTYLSPVTASDGTVVQNGFYASVSDSCSIGSYAVGDSIISAGAFAARNSYYSYYKDMIIEDRTVTIGDICSFSSYQAPGIGPTGAALPTVCAPGYYVVAAGSRYSYFASRHINTVMKTEDGCYWGVMSGTSMAAPTVAGIIALWLQAKPDLSVAEIKDIIAQTAIKDAFTSYGENSIRFGPNGKIDALAGMDLVLRHMDVLRGDANSDGVVNIIDLTVIIDYLLTGQSGDTFNPIAADVDENGNVSVTDVSALIDLMLKAS